MLAKGSEYWILGGAALTAFMGFFTPYALTWDSPYAVPFSLFQRS